MARRGKSAGGKKVIFLVAMVMLGMMAEDCTRMAKGTRTKKLMIEDGGATTRWTDEEWKS